MERYPSNFSKNLTQLAQEDKIVNFWRKLEHVNVLDYTRVKLPETMDIPLRIIRLQRHLPFRFYNRSIFKKLSNHRVWYLYRTTRLKKKLQGKQLVLTFDCDYREDTLSLKKILPILRRHNIKASFAVVGKLVERDKSVYEEVCEEMHELVNHTYTHPSNPVLSSDRRFDQIPEVEQREEIVKCHNVIEKIARKKPVSFRSPHFYDNLNEFKLLDELGYKYCSSVTTSNSMLGLPYRPAKSGLGECSYFLSGIGEKDNFNILMIPVEVCPDHPSVIYSTYHTIRSKIGVHQKPEEFYNLWVKLLKNDYKNFVCVYFDPMDISKSEKMLKEFERMLVFAQNEGWTFKLIREVRPEIWQT